LIATTNLSRLTSYTTARDQLPSKFHKVKRINTLGPNKITTATPITPHINRFGGNTGKYGSNQARHGNGNRNSSGNFKYCATRYNATHAKPSDTASAKTSVESAPR
jgi:hypothetical protein